MIPLPDLFLRKVIFRLRGDSLKISSSGIEVEAEVEVDWVRVRVRVRIGLEGRKEGRKERFQKQSMKIEHYIYIYN